MSDQRLDVAVHAQKPIRDLTNCGEFWPYRKIRDPKLGVAVHVLELNQGDAAETYE